jgi:uncharacterized protein YjeT (DUF2065 family)
MEGTVEGFPLLEAGQARSKASAAGDPVVSNTLLAAFALMLVIEGVLPFLVPTLWRDTFRRLTELSDGQIRFIGLTSMLAGLLLLYIVRP